MSIVSEIRAGGAFVGLKDGQIAIRGAGAADIERVKQNKSAVINELRLEQEAGESAYRKMDEMLDIAYLFRKHGADPTAVADLVGMIDQLQELALSDYFAYTLLAKTLAVDVMATIKAIRTGQKVYGGAGLAQMAREVMESDTPPQTEQPKVNKSAFAPAPKTGNRSAFAPAPPKQGVLA